MTTEQIFAALTEVMRDVFDDDSLQATPAMTAADVEAWDSLGNVRLFLAVEQRFGVRIRAAEINEVQNVGELVALIERKR